MYKAESFVGKVKVVEFIRAERGFGGYSKAYRIFVSGRMSDKHITFILRLGDSKEIVALNKQAKADLRNLSFCKLGKFDKDIILDLYRKDEDVETLYSKAQCELIAKKALRYKKQIAALPY